MTSSRKFGVDLAQRRARGEAILTFVDLADDQVETAHARGSQIAARGSWRGL